MKGCSKSQSPAALRYRRATPGGSGVERVAERCDWRLTHSPRRQEQARLGIPTSRLPKRIAVIYRCRTRIVAFTARGIVADGKVIYLHTVHMSRAWTV
jgi:hypothetical protein